MMPLFHMIKIIAVSFLIHSSMSFPMSADKDIISLVPRADEDCFATGFGIADFHAFNGSDTEPAYISFKAGSDGFEGRLLCSKKSSTPLHFLDPVPCNNTASSGLFFSYPRDNLLRVHEVSACGTTE